MFFIKGSAKIGIKKTRKHIENTVSRELSIEAIGVDLYTTNSTFPALLFRIKLGSKSDFNLKPQNMLITVMVGNSMVDKITWSHDEHLLRNYEKKNHGVGSKVPYEIPKKKNETVELYYNILPVVDYSGNPIKLKGLITLDCGYGVIVKKLFIIPFDINKDEWIKQIKEWKSKFGNSILTVSV